MPRHLPVASNTERSQKLLQKLVARPLFGKSVLGQPVKWVSPIVEDQLAEYNDADFLGRLAITTSRTALKEFWPRGGPHWDGLGIADDGTAILVEAKAYIEEMDSDSCKASPASLAKIQSALGATALHMGAKPKGDLTRSFYQMTNRLAHLYFLHHLNRIPAELWLVCFCNHPDASIRTTKEEWLGAIRLLNSHLGLRSGAKLMNRVRHVFVDSGTLELV
ncbi:hypothetical protein DES53_103213 [Roseimicrobium gellanilyticum]|uniref:Uncharacterized protein n=1 Tax=Roseimicrobium gellanilyticum TaxID=748857 RepID=A0A366HNZ5_9BACT|nr:hypothetical protein [Roseimicrobium gellanilyticum]RBP45215.1 hypothetical protein DES53_103213 [Roseimicrobium gellanilyticum]